MRGTNDRVTKKRTRERNLTKDAKIKPEARGRELHSRGRVGEKADYSAETERTPKKGGGIRRNEGQLEATHPLSISSRDVYSG